MQEVLETCEKRKAIRISALAKGPALWEHVVLGSKHRNYNCKPKTDIVNFTVLAAKIAHMGDTAFVDLCK